MAYRGEVVYTQMPRFFSPVVSFTSASYWWWYGFATEGAAASA
jgi:hypothetical protein